MSVKLRERILKSGDISYYLDIYNPFTGERTYDFLFKSSSKQKKNDSRRLAEQIRNQREIELNTQRVDFQPSLKRKILLHNFVDNYISSYNKKDIRVLISVSLKVKEFFSSKLYISDITETDMINFADYLNNRSGLNGETPETYYKRFKKMIIQANRENLIDDKVYRNVKFKSKTESSKVLLKKQVLTEEELKLLFITDCGNNEVKRAFLFSCYTGLGLAEINRLQWKNIENDRLKITRSKTGNEINIKLSPTALSLLGERRMVHEFIFQISVSHHSVNKDIKYWLKRAGIAKHITFYSGRHTFATRLLINGTNLKTVSDSLAHKNIENTIKYLNYVNSLKDDATSSLE